MRLCYPWQDNLTLPILMQLGVLVLVLTQVVNCTYFLLPSYFSYLLAFSLTLPSLKLGFGQPQPQVTARSMAPTAGLRPPTNVPASKADGAKLSNEQKSRSPVLEDSFLDQSQKGQQNSGSLNAQDATASERKAFPYIYLLTFTIFFWRGSSIFLLWMWNFFFLFINSISF